MRRRHDGPRHQRQRFARLPGRPGRPVGRLRRGPRSGCTSQPSRPKRSRGSMSADAEAPVWTGRVPVGLTLATEASGRELEPPTISLGAGDLTFADADALNEAIEKMRTRPPGRLVTTTQRNRPPPRRSVGGSCRGQALPVQVWGPRHSHGGMWIAAGTREGRPARIGGRLGTPPGLISGPVN